MSSFSLNACLLWGIITAYGAGIPYHDYDVCYPRTECERGYSLPHNTACDRYRVCNGAEWVMMPCSKDLRYDYTKNPNECLPEGICWSDENNCDGHTPPPTVTPPECVGNETCLCPAVPNNCTGDMTLAHRYDCTKFYLCVHDRLLPQHCPAGLYFNLDTGSCTDVDSKFECMDRCPISTTLPLSSESPSGPISSTTLPTRFPVFPTQGVPPAGSSWSLLVFMVVGCVTGGVLIGISGVILYQRSVCKRNGKVAPSSNITSKWNEYRIR